MTHFPAIKKNYMTLVLRLPVPIGQHEVSSRKPLSCVAIFIFPTVAIDANRRYEIIRHHLEDDILVTVTKRRPERIRRVRRASPVQNDGPLARLKVAAQLVPFTVGGNLKRTVDVDQLRPNPVRFEYQRKFTTVIHVEVVMSRVVRVEHEFFNTVGSRIEQDVLKIYITLIGFVNDPGAALRN